MSKCSTGDAFEVYSAYKYNGFKENVSLSGCYKDSGETQHGVIKYSLDGIEFRDTSHAPDVPIAFSSYHTEAAWYLGTEWRSYGNFYMSMCRDVELRNTSTLHPSEVTQWECIDAATGNYTLEDSMTTTCGCSTPQPSVAPPPSPEPEPTTICSSGDSFLVATDVTEDGDSLSGCFEDTGSIIIDGPVYYESPMDEQYGESAMVYTVDIYPDFPVWVLGMERRVLDGIMHVVTVNCVDADHQNASTLHPTEVRQWDCYDNYDGPLANPVTMTCGCDTLAPTWAPDGTGPSPGSTFSPTVLWTQGPSQGPSQAPTQGPTQARTEGPTCAPSALTPGLLRRLGGTSAFPNSATGEGGASMLAGGLGGAFVVCGLIVGLLLKTGRLKALSRGNPSTHVSV